MTTNENDVAMEPIVEVDDSPRSLDILLTLPTYQGMTDEEIEIVLTFKREQAITEKTLEKIESVANDSRRAYDAVLGNIMDNAIYSQKLLRERLTTRQYHQLQPLTVSATTLELEVAENG